MEAKKFGTRWFTESLERWLEERLKIGDIVYHKTDIYRYKPMIIHGYRAKPRGAETTNYDQWVICRWLDLGTKEFVSKTFSIKEVFRLDQLKEEKPVEVEVKPVYKEFRKNLTAKRLKWCQDQRAKGGFIPPSYFQ